MNAKACPDCGRIFRDWVKWTEHNADGNFMCKKKKARLRAVREEQITQDILDGKRGYNGKLIRRC